MLALNCENLDDIDIDVNITDQRDIDGAVYVMTNDPEGNKIVGYERKKDGCLEKIGIYETGGNGRDITETGFDPLESQDALILDKEKKLLFAVNAGSNSITSFIIQDDGSLIFSDTNSSNGEGPVALAFNGEALYVANREGGGSISGYTVSSTGKLKFIEDSTIDGRGTYAGSIDFTADGRNLIIAEKGAFAINGFFNINGTNAIVSMPLDENYKPLQEQEKIIHLPLEYAVFAGEIFNDIYIMSIPGAITPSIQNPEGTLISYKVKDNGELELKTIVEQGIPDGATCWLEISKDGKIVYGSNTFAGTITTYDIKDNGEISVREILAGEVPFGGRYIPRSRPPIDIGGILEIVESGNFLYANTSIKPRLDVFEINSDGSLTEKPELQLIDEKLFSVGKFYGLASF